MHKLREASSCRCRVLLLGIVIPATGWAESFEAGGVTLHKETVMYVDAVEGEFLLWQGSGGVAFTTTTGYGAGWFAGYTYEVPDTTTWTIRITADQTGTWDMAVLSADKVPQYGRVYSTRWIVSADTGSSAGFSESFYLPAPVDETAASVPDAAGQVMKLRVEGLYGERMEIIANTAGVPGTAPQSAPFSDKTSAPSADLRLYLEHLGYLSADWPESPTTLLSASYDDPDCPVILLEETGVTLAFDTELSGYAEIVCDLSGDAAYDPTGGDMDLVGRFEECPASLSWYWAGEDLRTEKTGIRVEPGSYTCLGGVHLSPVHALVANADVADPGVRLFAQDTGSTTLELFWDDSRLPDDVLLESGARANVESGAGVYSGDPNVRGVANRTAHGWGNVSTAESRGSWGWIDTWAAGRFYRYGTTEVSVHDPDGDEDGDGLTSREECDLGTHPGQRDSDGGGADDGQELADGTDPSDPTDDIVPDTDDTGAADPDPDGASGVVDFLGDFSGGALACSATPHAPRLPEGLLLLVVVAVGGRRRRVS